MAPAALRRHAVCTEQCKSPAHLQPTGLVKRRQLRHSRPANIGCSANSVSAQVIIPIIQDLPGESPRLYKRRTQPLKGVASSAKKNCLSFPSVLPGFSGAGHGWWNKYQRQWQALSCAAPAGPRVQPLLQNRTTAFRKAASERSLDIKL